MRLYRVHGFGCGNRQHDEEGFATKPRCKEWCGDQDKCVVALRDISDDASALVLPPEAVHGHKGDLAVTLDELKPDAAPSVEHPMQPLVMVDDVLRFKENAIVRQLLDFAQPRGFGLNQMAAMEFSDEDRQQFAQLIGYSLDGYGTLSYVTDEAYDRAEAMRSNEESREQD